MTPQHTARRPQQDSARVPQPHDPDTAAPALAATARNLMDRIRYMVLGTNRRGWV